MIVGLALFTTTFLAILFRDERDDKLPRVNTQVNTSEIPKITPTPTPLLLPSPSSVESVVVIKQSPIPSLSPRPSQLKNNSSRDNRHEGDDDENEDD